MNVSSTGAATPQGSAHQTATRLDAAMMRKAKEQQEIEGRQALELIESAGTNPRGQGQIINDVA